MIQTGPGGCSGGKLAQVRPPPPLNQLHADEVIILCWQVGFDGLIENDRLVMVLFLA